MKYALSAVFAACALAGCETLTGIGADSAPETSVPAEAGPPLRGDDALPVDTTALHDRVLTMDTHIDIDAGYATYRLDPGTMTRAQADLPKMRAGGLDAGFFIVYVGQGTISPMGYAEAAAIAERDEELEELEASDEIQDDRTEAEELRDADVRDEESDDPDDDYDWEELLNSSDDLYGYKARVDHSQEEDEREMPMPAGTSMAEHLRDQLTFLDLSEDEEVIAEQIIGSIDEDGYLRRPLDSIIDDIMFNHGITIDETAFATAPRTSYVLEPGERRTTWIRFAPAAAGAFGGTLCAPVVAAFYSPALGDVVFGGSESVAALTRMGRWSEESSRLATSRAPPRPSTSAKRMANSSPPRRATRSLSRTPSRRRAPVAVRTRSPTSWP